MPAQHYYDATSPDHRGGHQSMIPDFPHHDFQSYERQPFSPDSPYMSPSNAEYGYRPFDMERNASKELPETPSRGPPPSHQFYGEGSSPPQLSNRTPAADYPNSYADHIPLRQQAGGKSGMIKDSLNDHLEDDPAMIDRPTGHGRRRSKHSRGHRSAHQKQGFFSHPIPWVVYSFTIIQIVVFIAELAKNGALTKSPIEIHPNFNPMIGPSPYVLINMGARFRPCMRAIPADDDVSTVWPCPNLTSNDPHDSSYSCSLNQLCGFNDGPYGASNPPNQWYRFIIPIFLHQGIIHITVNMILQIFIGTEMEREIGPLRFFLVYISSGIFGFVLGGNLASSGLSSVGASGSLFGVIALLLLDLFYHWSQRRSPWLDLTWIVVDIVICFVLGLLPGPDNFAHIGGFLMGIVLGLCILHSPEVLRRRAGMPRESGLADDQTMSSSHQSRQSRHRNVPGDGLVDMAKQPIGFFKNRKPFWWAWWLIRAAALIGALIAFVALIKNFYKPEPTTCWWCKYLSCINIKNWCEISNLTMTNTTTTSPNRRSLTQLAGTIEMNPFLQAIR